jgi:peptidoglycan/LPS O-acetylase OafA/YrhL
MDAGRGARPDALDRCVAHEAVAVGERRVPALDGLRGLMTIAVVLSHYFGELPHGISAFTFGWIAVDMFFVLSGYLVGTLILDKMDRSNFLAVFFIRRACRTVPAYALCVTVLFVLARYLGDLPWIESEPSFALSSYLSFTQNFVMAARESIGPHWLAPTWTLALEEHFYVVTPALFFLVPRRRLLVAMLIVAAGAVAFRAATQALGAELATVVLLPARADLLIAGLFLATLMRTAKVDLTKNELKIRVIPLAALAAVIMIQLVDRAAGMSSFFNVLSPTVVAIGCASFILALVRGAPEARRFQSRRLHFFGRISYSTYLIHIPVLVLMHHAVLGASPDLATWAQLAVTLAALPVVVLGGWLLTKVVEEPITAYGRSFRWSEPALPLISSPGSAATEAGDCVSQGSWVDDRERAALTDADEGRRF